MGKITIEAMVKDMTRDLSDQQRKSIQGTLRAALKSFSVKQWERMKKAGVRVWPGSTAKQSNSAPPPFRYSNGNAWLQPLTVSENNVRAQYEHASRVIFYHSKVTAADLRHELVHAWDHVRSAKKWKRFDDIKSETDRQSKWQAQAKLNRSAVMWSGQNAALASAFKKYKQRATKRAACFDNPKTRECHSLKGGIHEFYAEGYSVFHGDCDGCKKRLLTFAEELYDILEQEATSNSLSVPDRDKLDDN